MIHSIRVVFRKALLYSERCRIPVDSGTTLDAYMTNLNDAIIAHLRALLTRNLQTKTEDGA